jgi:hypothetical protein
MARRFNHRQDLHVSAASVDLQHRARSFELSLDDREDHDVNGMQLVLARSPLAPLLH